MSFPEPSPTKLYSNSTTTTSNYNRKHSDFTTKDIKTVTLLTYNAIKQKRTFSKTSEKQEKTNTRDQIFELNS